MSDVQAEVNDQTKQSFQSLLDDAARMTQTCTTICIYAADLQRKGKAPTVRRQFPYPTPELDQVNRYEV